MMKIYDLNQVPEEEIFLRQEEAADVSAPVADILRDVKERGDAALLDYAKKFDKAELSTLEVTPQELEEGGPPRWTGSLPPFSRRPPEISAPSTPSRSGRAFSWPSGRG